MTTSDRPLHQTSPHPEARTGPPVAEGSCLEWVVVESFPVAEFGNQVGARRAEEMASRLEAWASVDLEHRKGWAGMAGMASRGQGALQQVRRGVGN